MQTKCGNGAWPAGAASAAAAPKRERKGSAAAAGESKATPKHKRPVPPKTDLDDLPVMPLDDDLSPL